MSEEPNRFQRIKSLLQDTKLIDSHTISLVVAECDMALTQRPAAQAVEREVFEAWWADSGFEKFKDTAFAAWQARASLPTPPAAQATPEPVAWFGSDGKLQGRVSAEQLEQLCREAILTLGAEERQRGVPEGFVLVPVEPTPEMLKAMETQWLVGSQVDMAKREYAAMLAAAQAKGQ